jgi:hypothetical protein
VPYGLFASCQVASGGCKPLADPASSEPGRPGPGLSAAGGAGEARVTHAPTPLASQRAGAMIVVD